MDRATSVYWANVLLHPHTRCAICGLPNMMMKVYSERGWPWFLGKHTGAGSHPHLTLDHIVPGVIEGGFRPLCSACNSMRGAEQFTDEEVLQRIRDKWHWYMGLRFLWWLNTSPGEGGRLHRSKRCADRDAETVQGQMPLPQLGGTHESRPEGDGAR